MSVYYPCLVFCGVTCVCIYKYKPHCHCVCTHTFLFITGVCTYICLFVTGVCTYICLFVTGVCTYICLFVTAWCLAVQIPAFTLPVLVSVYIPVCCHCFMYVGSIRCCTVIVTDHVVKLSFVLAGLFTYYAVSFCINLKYYYNI